MAKTESISGTVYDSSNKTVSGATVSCKNESTSTIVTTTSDSKGRFTFTVNAGGTYYFFAEKDGVTMAAQLDPDDGVTTSTGLKY